MKPTVSEMTVSQQMPPKLAVTVTEMADMLSISRPFAYQILNREDFKGSFRIGNKRLVSVDALREWISNQTQENP